ncbi:MAG: glycosyltransferase family 4 protein [Patescibacteria group bacterium]
MRILYLNHARFPSEKAHSRQMAEVCSAVVRSGHDVTMVVPTVGKDVPLDPRAAFGVSPSFPVERLRHFDPWTTPLIPGFLKTLVGTWFFNRALRAYLRAHPADLLYLRSPLLLPTAVNAGAPVLLELHSLPRWRRQNFVRLCNRCRRVACLTSPMRDLLVSRGVDASRVAVEGDAADPARFRNLPAAADARTRFGIPEGRTVVGYVGRLKTMEEEKGIAVLLQALARLKEQQTWFGFIVGGPEGDRRIYENRARQLGLTGEDVRFTGHVPPADVPAALAACDILAMPFPDIPHYRLYMSPLKMFEYMAAGRPIVTSDLPAVRDVLDESSAFFCRPGDAEDLARTLEDVRQHPEEAQRRAVEARGRVQEHTWEKRMGRILALP